MRFPIAVALLTVLAGWAAAAQGPPAAAPGPAGTLAYLRIVDEKLQVRLADAELKNDRPLPGIRTPFPVHPALSPDGKQVAFCAPSITDPGSWDLYRINANGSELKQLVIGATLPAWSPDGKRLLFCYATDPPAIGVVNADGSESRPLPVRLPLSVAPFWSPDGKRIAFSGSPRRRAQLADVYLADADGRNVQQLTDGKRLYLGGGGAWSPDGQRLVLFSADPKTRAAELQLWDVATKETRVVADFGIPVDPTAVKLDANNTLRMACWSPDGRWILATLGTPRGPTRGELGLFRLAPDGSAPKRLTPDGANCFYGSWGR